jgi:putative ABC transport system permease protein
MFKLALKSTLAKKRRLFGTALSVMIGVAFLAGTLVFTDTIRRTFDDLFAGIYADTDSYVRAETSVDLTQGVSQRARMPGAIVATVAAVPGVAEARGIVSGYAQIVGSDGKAIGNPGRGAPTIGMSNISGALSPWQLTKGGRSPGAGELVVDKHSADVGHLKLGDTVKVLTQTGPHEFTLVGTARFGSVDSPGGASVALFDLATAQQVLLGGADNSTR